jgi:hypothetical protein
MSISSHKTTLEIEPDGAVLVTIKFWSTEPHGSHDHQRASALLAKAMAAASKLTPRNPEVPVA